MKSILRVKLEGTTTQIAEALRDLARRIDLWQEDHAPLRHNGNEKIAQYRAQYNDWEYADTCG